MWKKGRTTESQPVIVRHIKGNWGYDDLGEDPHHMTYNVPPDLFPCYGIPYPMKMGHPEYLKSIAKCDPR